MHSKVTERTRFLSPWPLTSNSDLDLEHIYIHWLIDWLGFNVALNTLQVIWRLTGKEHFSSPITSHLHRNKNMRNGTETFPPAGIQSYLISHLCEPFQSPFTTCAWPSSGDILTPAPHEYSSILFRVYSLMFIWYRVDLSVDDHNEILT